MNLQLKFNYSHHMTLAFVIFMNFFSLDCEGVGIWYRLQINGGNNYLKTSPANIFVNNLGRALLIFATPTSVYIFLFLNNKY